MKTISICIPVYNEASNVEVAVKTVEEVFAQSLANYRLEMIVTDNCSSDSTWEVVQRLAQVRKNLHGYRFSRNFGYQNSVFAGLSLSTGDAVVELDADLEDPPAVIVEFVKKWEQGYQVVYGIRQKRVMSIFKKIIFKLFYIILDRLSDFRIPRDTGDFRLLDRKVVDVLKMLPERNLYLRGLVTYLGFKQIGVLYSRNPRLSGESKFSFLQYIILAIDAVTAFSKAPLRLIGLCGALLFLMSFALGMYYLVGYLLMGVVVPGFVTTVILILFLNSINFIFLGTIGEYLSRIFDDSKFRPRVIIEDSTQKDQFPKIL